MYVARIVLHIWSTTWSRFFRPSSPPSPYRHCWSSLWREESWLRQINKPSYANDHCPKPISFHLCWYFPESDLRVKVNEFRRAIDFMRLSDEWYSLKPASLFSSPATRITTNFLKSLVEVGLLWPEFQPQAARDQDILSSPRVFDVISKFHDVQSRDFTICACMPVYEQNVSETRLLMNWWRAIGDVSGQITVRGRCKMKHMYTLYVWKVHNARETCIVVGNRSCEP